MLDRETLLTAMYNISREYASDMKEEEVQLYLRYFLRKWHKMNMSFKMLVEYVLQEYFPDEDPKV